VKLVIVAMVAGLCTFASAIELVLNRHATRTQFVELQSLRQTKEQLNEEWGQLLLEQAAWATQVRIESIARKDLDMVSLMAGQAVELR
jgi:cell division protein FtsL